MNWLKLLPTGTFSLQVLMYEQQVFYNGEPIDFNNLDLWDKFKVTFGINVTEKNKPNDKKFQF
ncbi:hypothetical protein, partial [Salmonella enterica]